MIKSRYISDLPIGAFFDWGTQDYREGASYPKLLLDMTETRASYLINWGGSVEFRCVDIVACKSPVCLLRPDQFDNYLEQNPYDIK